MFLVHLRIFRSVQQLILIHEPLMFQILWLVMLFSSVHLLCVVFVIIYF